MASVMLTFASSISRQGLGEVEVDRGERRPRLAEHVRGRHLVADPLRRVLGPVAPQKREVLADRRDRAQVLEDELVGCGFGRTWSFDWTLSAASFFRVNVIRPAAWLEGVMLRPSPT
jgi:hypothetical protein